MVNFSQLVREIHELLPQFSQPLRGRIRLRPKTIELEAEWEHSITHFSDLMSLSFGSGPSKVMSSRKLRSFCQI